MLYDGDATCGHARTTGVGTTIAVAVGAGNGVGVGRASHGAAQAASITAGNPAATKLRLRQSGLKSEARGCINEYRLMP